MQLPGPKFFEHSSVFKARGPSFVWFLMNTWGDSTGLVTLHLVSLLPQKLNVLKLICCRLSCGLFSGEPNDLYDQLFGCLLDCSVGELNKFDRELSFGTAYEYKFISFAYLFVFGKYKSSFNWLDQTEAQLSSHFVRVSGMFSPTLRNYLTVTKLTRSYNIWNHFIYTFLCQNRFWIYFFCPERGTKLNIYL